jgi:hypothetical protein
MTGPRLACRLSVTPAGIVFFLNTWVNAQRDAPKLAARVEIKRQKYRNFQSFPRFDGTPDASHHRDTASFLCGEICR